MGKAIVITSGKGGVGKTTTTANLGAGLSMMDKKVCLVDMDIGLRNLDITLGLEKKIIYNLNDIIDGTCKIAQAIVKAKDYDNLYLIAAAQHRDKDSIKEDQAKRLITELKKKFDYVLVDCPAGIEQGYKNAVAGADAAIVVTTPEVSAIMDADRIIGLLENAGIEEIDIIINKVRPNMVEKKAMFSPDDVIDVLAVDLIGVIPDDEAVVISANKGVSLITDIDKDLSVAGRAYKNICKRVLGDEIDFLDIIKDQKKIGWFEKLFLGKSA